MRTKLKDKIAATLDAPDEMLIERVRSRIGATNQFGSKTDEEAYEYLTRYRRSYDKTIARITSHGGPRVLHYETDQQSSDLIAEQVLSVLEKK